jgi:hypothetical protein
LPIWSRKWPFLDYTIEAAPLDPGVFALWQDGEIVFIGAGVTSIRQCLVEHFRGTHGPENQTADHYSWEVAVDPEERRLEILSQYERLHNGRWPRLNKRDSK